MNSTAILLVEDNPQDEMLILRALNRDKGAARNGRRKLMNPKVRMNFAIPLSKHAVEVPIRKTA